MAKETKGHISRIDKYLPSEERADRFETGLSVCLLLILTFLYFYFPGIGIFSYQENHILFIFSSDYVKEFAGKPGGLLMYAGNFLTQFYHFPLVGTIIISGLMLSGFILFRESAAVLKSDKQTRVFIAVLFTILLMMMQTRYDFHLHDLLGFVIALSWFILSARFYEKSAGIIFVLLFPLLYYLTGSYSFIYAGMYVSFCLVQGNGQKRIVRPAVLMSVFIVTWLVFRYILFYETPASLLSFPLITSSSTRLTLYVSLYSILMLMLPPVVILLNRYFEGRSVRPVILLSGIAVIAIASVTIILNTYDPVKANIIKFEKMAYDQDWDGIIRSQEKNQSANIVEQYFYNLALSQRGELCSRMFFGRQSYGSMALTLVRDDENSQRAMYFYYYIGLAGEAHHLAYEQMVQHGYRPENIRMLIRTELLNGNYQIAERYINVLDKTIFYRSWADKYRRMLNKPEAVKSDRELGRIMSLMPEKDFFVVTDDFSNLDMLLDANPGNTVAFEYKMARLLLEKDPMEAGKEVGKLKALGYNHIPRHIEEAIVALVNVTKEFPDMGGLAISQDTDQRFPEYFSDINSFRGNRQSLEKGIRKADRATFWYYQQFGLMRSDFFRKGQADPNIY